MKKVVISIILLGSVSLGITADSLTEVKLDKTEIAWYRKGLAYYPKEHKLRDEYDSYINRKYGFRYFDVKVAASSSLKSKYSAEKVLDNDISTAWVEGKKGFGRGEWIKIIIQRKSKSAPYQLRMDYVHIFSGLGMDSYFLQNNRLKTVICTLENGKKKKRLRFHFNDFYGFNGYGFTDLNNPTDKSLSTLDTIDTSDPWIMTLEIESVYPGTKYDDTCISEINIGGTESPIEDENAPFP